MLHGSFYIAVLHRTGADNMLINRLLMGFSASAPSIFLWMFDGSVSSDARAYALCDNVWWSLCFAVHHFKSFFISDGAQGSDRRLISLYRIIFHKLSSKMQHTAPTKLIS
jgi:hypothetical protein